MNQRPKAKVLLVEDQPTVAAALCGVISDAGHVVTSVNNGEACLTELHSNHYDVVLLDLWIGEMDGLSVLREIQQLTLAFRPPVVVITAQDDLETRSRVRELGAYSLVGKPMSIDSIIGAIQYAIRDIDKK